MVTGPRLDVYDASNCSRRGSAGGRGVQAAAQSRSCSGQTAVCMPGMVPGWDLPPCRGLRRFALHAATAPSRACGLRGTLCTPIHAAAGLTSFLSTL